MVSFKNKGNVYMSEQYKMGIFVMDYLQGLGVDMITIGQAIDDKNLKKSYLLIKENPTISKKEFFRVLGINEF